MLQIENLNPFVKLCTILICVIIIALFFDPITPLVVILWVIVVTQLFSHTRLKWWLLFLLPVSLFSFGYVWSAILFPNLEEGQAKILWDWGWIKITEAGLQKGLSIGLRMIAFASLSFMFVVTTKPVPFIYSLMQQAKLPPKLAYGIMAGYRFVPLFREELTILQKAHRIRGVDRAKGFIERSKRLGRYLIPLLASAIRKAERTAMAMESKGFTGSRKRTFYYVTRIRMSDGIFFLMMIAGVLIAILCSWKLGYLQWYRGQL